MAAPKKNSDRITEPVLVTPPHGRGKLLTGGKPGNKGGGRPADEFKRRMRELAAIADTPGADDQKSYLERCIEGEFGPGFYFRALEFTADRGYGKPTQSVEVYDFDPTDFTETGLERVASGEDPVHVLTTGGRVNRTA